MFRMLFQFLYPPLCRSCRCPIVLHEFLCQDCATKIKPVVSLLVPLSKRKTLKVYAAGAYQGPLRSLILKKISSDLLASRQLGQLMVKMIPFDVIPCDYVVPIPLHWTRYASRGFNQAGEMAKVIGKKLQVPVVPILVRRKRTKFQAFLSALARQENLNEAFGMRWRYRSFFHKNIEGKDVVLVDDLYTTGATILSAAKIINEYKPRSITAVVACRAI